MKCRYVVSGLNKIVNTLLKDEFKKFVRDKVQQNEKKVVLKRRMVVDAKPAFINLFRNSNMVSSLFESLLHFNIGSKGRFHTLVSGFRKRRFTEIEKDSNEEELKELKKINEMNERTIAMLNNKLDKYGEDEIENKDNLAKLSKLYEMGVINEDGEYIDSRNHQEEGQ